jgi:hypothetical protein
MEKSILVNNLNQKRKTMLKLELNALITVGILVLFVALIENLINYLM